MILGSEAHIFWYEQGGSAALGGIHPRTVQNEPDGRIPVQKIEAAIRADDVHFPRTRLIVLENTHNRCSGSPLDVAYMESVGALARRHGLKIHVDGARIFNAAVSLGVEAAALAAEADSVSFCLSKGLCAPVGSLVCGRADFVRRARRMRKVLGGGMRQAGVIAAAGIVALEKMVDRLAEDHDNARRLAEGLSRIEGFRVDPERVRTNIVFIDTAAAGVAATELTRRLDAEGIRCLPLGPEMIRAVTHHPIIADDIDYALERFAAAAAG
jgi:threonine aldolase